MSRVALISGATSGIGEAAASAFVRAGMVVVGSGRRKQRLERLEQELAAGPGRFIGHSADMTQAGACARMLEFACSEAGAFPTIFLLCAGHGLPGTLLGSDPQKWQALLETNCLAVMRQVREYASSALDALDRAVAAPPVDIVVIGSTVGRTVSAFNPVYGATKFAVHSIVEGLRQEICHRGVRVSLVEPGFVRTEFQSAAGYDEDWFSRLEREAGRFLSADDVARTIAFVVAQPEHVHLDDIRIRSTRQRV
jgi:NADP-dependent 3-hydroxy acid dehydrogenase YdfG